MYEITEAKAKQNAAIECVREHLSHVAPNGAECYADRHEAYQAARDVAAADMGPYVDRAIDEAEEKYGEECLAWVLGPELYARSLAQ